MALENAAPLPDPATPPSSNNIALLDSLGLHHETYSFEELCEFLKCEKDTLYRLLHNGKIRGLERGRAPLFLAVDVARYLLSLPEWKPGRTCNVKNVRRRTGSSRSEIDRGSPTELQGAA